MNNFYYENRHLGCINDYYNYIAGLILKIIQKRELNNINIILGNCSYNFNNNLKTIKININYEHTLVKKGANYGVIESEKALVEGKIKIKDRNENYLVRIIHYTSLSNSDIIIDYSIPNIYNIEISEYFEDLSKKLIYISPTIYDIDISNTNRKIDVLTTFIDINQPRRKALYDNLNDNFNYKNVNNCFDKKDLKNIYQNTKILINIHQTDHHHTFEELRVLPALLNGIIIISEDSPLKEMVPYNKYIIWTDYDNIIEKTKDILDNYDKYYNDIFNENFKIEDSNQDRLESKLVILAKE